MKKEYIITLVLAMILIPTTILLADNTVGGSNQPWEGEDDDSTTVVAPVEVGLIRSQRIYDLSGHRIDSPQRGKIYIVNGKKMIWKE